MTRARPRPLAALGRVLRGGPPYPLTAALATAALCVAEVVAIEGPAGPLYGLYLVCLLLPLSALHGALWVLALALVARLPRWLRRLTWPLIGATAGVALAERLGAFARLDTRYDFQALAVLGGATGGGLVLGVLVALLQPSPARPLGWLGGRGPTVRCLVAAVLLVATGGCAFADHTLYVGLYVSAHVALRLCSAWCAMFALALLPWPRVWPVLSGRAVLILALVFLVPVATLDEGQPEAVQAFVMRPWSAMLLRVARSALDLDRDGFAAVLGGGDCDDFNPKVHPAAREVPDNGIDDNCAFGDRKATAPKAQEAIQMPEDEAPMSVVLITIDALRFDRLGVNDAAFGPNGKDTAPRITEWARDAVNFERAYTPGGWTSVAVSSMLRGRYARKLKWTAYFETKLYRMLRRPFPELYPGEQIAKMFPVAWGDPHPSISSWLKRRGMKTAAVVDDGFSQMMSKAIGADAGFDVYREINPDPPWSKRPNKAKQWPRAPRERDDTSTATSTISALRWTVREQRFFLWTHFFGPHTPSTDHKGTRKDDDSIEGGYDQEVRFVDQQVGRVLDAIDGLETEVAVFITADHGERFYRHYRSHGADLSEEIIHVPLLARVPGWAPVVVKTPVSLVDLFPTIAALTGTPPPHGLDGIDLAPLVKGASPPKRLLFSDTWQFDRDGKGFNDLVAAFDGKRKVVLDRRSHSFSVFDPRRPDAAPVPIEGLAVDEAARAILGYVEEAGGSLDLSR